MAALPPKLEEETYREKTTLQLGPLAGRGRPEELAMSEGKVRPDRRNASMSANRESPGKAS